MLQRRLDNIIAQRIALHNEALVAYGVVIALLVAAGTAVSLVAAHIAPHFTANFAFALCMICLLIFLGFAGRAAYYLDSVLEDKIERKTRQGLFAAATIAQMSCDDFLQSIQSVISEKAIEEIAAQLHAEAVKVHLKQQARGKAFFSIGIMAATFVVALLFSVGLFGKVGVSTVLLCELL